MTPRRPGLGGKPLSADSPLLGGTMPNAEPTTGEDGDATAGAEGSNGQYGGFDPRPDYYAAPAPFPRDDADHRG